MGDTYSHGFIAGGEEKHVITSKDLGGVPTMCQASSYDGRNEDAILPTLK